MSIFPTKILLATDGSKEAELAFASAADLSEKTGSELHIVYVGHMPLVSYEAPGATTLDSDLQRRMQEGAQKEARTKLDEQVQRVGESGGEVAEAHARLGRPDAEIVAWLMSLGPGSLCWEAGALGP
jgi:nucleotide-binding universal stress UspA family protein